MMVKQTLRYLLPPIVVDAARWLRTSVRPRRQTAGGISIAYESAPKWITGRLGTVSFDFDVVKRSPDSELQVPIVRDNLEALAQTAPPGAKLDVLDFGSGNGHYKVILSANPHTRHWRYVGVDTMPEAIEFCRRAFPATRFELVEQGSPLPFDDGEFDVVLASSVVQYIRDPALAFAELHRVSREYVLVSRLPNWKYDAPQIVKQTIRGPRGEIQVSLHVFNRERVEEMFVKAGFSVTYRDTGSEFFWLAGRGEPVTHSLYLLRKTGV